MIMKFDLFQCPLCTRHFAIETGSYSAIDCPQCCEGNFQFEERVKKVEIDVDKEG